MSVDLIAVLPEVDELAQFVGRMRLMGREHGNHGICPNAIEGVGVARDDAFERVVLEDGPLEGLLVVGLARHCRLRDDDGSAGPLGEGVQEMLHEGNLILRGVAGRPLRIRRVHKSDARAFLHELVLVRLEEVAALDVGLAVPAQNHVGDRQGEHLAVALDAVDLHLADVLALGVGCGIAQHRLHGRDEEAARAAAGIEDGVVRPHLDKVAHEVADVARGEDDSERLAIAAAVAHELAVKAPDYVLARILVLD